MNTPLVSVIVPNYNAEVYIQSFLEGMLAQTYRNWELIIVDDKSTDNSPEIVRKFAENDSRIKLLVRQDDNKGACQRRNQGFDASKGEYVIFFDSDDLIPNDTLEIRVKEIESDKNLDFLVTPAISFINHPYDIKKLALGIPLFNDDLAMFIKRFRLPFGVWTNIYRRSFLERTGIRWDENLSSLQDSDFNINCIAEGAKYRFSINQKPGYFWRVGGNPNSITKGIKNRKDLDSQLYFYSKLHDRFKGTQYQSDVERFGLTLLNRFALCQYTGNPTILFSKKGREFKYHILKKIYSQPLMHKIHPLINLIASPIAIFEEYCFLVHNRRLCRHYITSQIKNENI